jgi:hypothetical protein
VNVDDLVLVILQWGVCTMPCTADISPTPCNPDGVVSVDELFLVILGWTGDDLCPNCTPTGTGAGATIEDYEDCENLCANLTGNDAIACMQACFAELCRNGQTAFCE